ncbi:MAG: class I SAM-dependent RNA methyltransferase [Brevinematia bacterium]
MEIKKFEEVIVKVLEIGKEGLCTCETKDGTKIFTRYAIPNEIVKVKIFDPSLPYGEITEIMEKSPIRVEPLCKYFGECGGCDIQMLDYRNQLEYKKKLLIEEFSKVPNFSTLLIKDPIPSPKEFYYRNSVMFRVNPKRKKIGFLKRDTNIVIDIEECKIALEKINYALKVIREDEEFPQHVFKVRGTLDGDVVVNLIKTKNFEDRAVYETITLDNISFRFRISRESFFQVNTYIIPIWLKEIRRLILNSPYKKDSCLDLYCGSGIISFFLSDIFQKIIGVEVSKPSVEDGKHNIEINKIKNVEIILSDVTKAIENLEIPEIIVVDPSRSGIEEKVINQLLESSKSKGKPKMIIYSSCNYETQVRDILKLQKGGFEIKEVIPIDMFPQTHHIEVIASLEKS